jgi:CheY-like chemotaxis protein
MGAYVLVVDDDLDIRCTLAQILREEGYRVREARDGEDALAKVAEEIPDLILLDLMMPRMTGWQLLEAFRLVPAYRQIPVVVLTAVPGLANLELCTDVIGKPVSFDRLVRLLQTVHANVGSHHQQDT